MTEKDSVMHTKKIWMIFLIVCFSCLFLCSCGLDDYYVLDPPVALKEVSADTSDQNEMYYQFKVPAVSLSASSQISMKGTAVYYCLYNNKTTLTSDISRIKTENKEYSENGFNRMKSSSSTYQMMTFTMEGYSSEYLNTTVSSEQYRIDMNMYSVSSGDSREINLLKATRISDGSVFQISIPKPEPGEWYLNAYAVMVGDVSFQPHYSQLAPLGVLKFTVQ